MTRALIVEDKEENLYLLRALLEGHGFEVAAARHGAEALVLARGLPPDIVISDLLMPVMDGYTLLRHWKTDERLRLIPFVVYTATYTEPKDEHLAMNLGADAFILKPAEPEDFMARIREILALRTSLGPVSPREPVLEEKAVLQEYSQTLIRKLEEKTLQLTEANRALERELIVRKEAEAELRRLNRALRTLSESNQTLIRATDEGRLVEAVCRIAVNLGGYRFAWVGFAGQDENKTVRPVARAGHEEGYLKTLHLTWADTGPGCGSTGTAIRTGEPQVIRDVATDPGFAPWRQEALKRGYASKIALPLKADGRTFGALSIYSEHPNAFDAAETALLKELADDLAFGIHTLRLRAQNLNAELARRESELRLRQLVEGLPVAVYTLDAEGRITLCNEAAVRLWGRQPELGAEKWCGAKKLYSAHGEPMPPDQSPMARALRERRAVGEVEAQGERPDGSRFTFMAYTTPLHDAAGQFLATMNVMVDISSHKHLEAQLRQSQKMEAIGQLAGGVAHDFNNLLTIIQGNASLLLQPALPAQNHPECARQIMEAAERAANLTRQLLLFSRKQVMQPADLDLNEIVGGMTKMLQRILGEDITLHSEFAPNLPTVRADAGMLEQVLLNLAVNSRDAMPGGGQLLIATGFTNVREGEARQNPDAISGPCVFLSVSDNGCGIPPELLSRIFEPFFTTKAPGKGTGLGLATVYGIVRQHHGWIEVSSEPGLGTTFRICLPAIPGLPRPAPAEVAPPPPRGGTETIFVVEDEAILRNLVANVLQRAGYRVLTAESGVAALQVWRERQGDIDLLFTDMIMPDGLTGRELADQLLAGQPSLKVILTSGYSPDMAGKETDLVEGRTFLQKPYHPHKLLHTVRNCLDGR